MKFCKNLARVVDLSDPEWGPYWMSYKYLKKKINDIVLEQGGTRAIISLERGCNQSISKSASEVEFFKVLKYELQKTSDFFENSEAIYKVRHARVVESYQHFLENNKKDSRFDTSTWTRLLSACVKFYKDVLLLENFAIMNYCGFSKILKKHDKLTGFSTRDAYMRNVMSKQNFTHYPYVLNVLREMEKLFEDIQSMQNSLPMQAEEKLFIDAIRDLNYQASRLQAEEIQSLKDSCVMLQPLPSDASFKMSSKLFIHSTNHGDSSRDEELQDFDNVDLDRAAIAVADAAGRVHPSPSVMNAVSWMTAIRSNTLLEPVEKCGQYSELEQGLEEKAGTMEQDKGTTADIIITGKAKRRR